MSTHEYKPAEVLYRKSGISESQLAKLREAAVNCGMALSYWGTKADKQCWISPSDRPTNPPEIDDLYGVVGSNYVRVFHHWGYKTSERKEKETQLINAIREALGDVEKPKK